MTLPPKLRNAIFAKHKHNQATAPWIPRPVVDISLLHTAKDESVSYQPYGFESSMYVLLCSSSQVVVC